MHAIIIIGGKSRRFWPLTEKALFPIAGKSLLEHQIDRLRGAGITAITIVANGQNVAQVQAKAQGCRVVEQPANTIGMHWACKAALQELPNSPVIIVSGNDVIEASAYAELQKTAQGKAGALLAYEVSTYFPGGYLQVKDDRITGIIEKPKPGTEPSNLVNIVAHIHNEPQALLAALEAQTDGDDAYERALTSLFATHHYQAHHYAGKWQALKYPWHVLNVSEFLLDEVAGQQIDPTASIHPTATISGNVRIGPGTRVLPHASIVGPCVIGSNCIIGNNSLVRGSSIGDDCVIGFGSEIKSSVLASHVWTHMTYLGDSVIGHNVSFGGGSITGNFRLDEAEISIAIDETTVVPTGRTKLGLMVGEHCRFGIRVSCNPGVRIGAHTFVSGNLMLQTDVPDESFVTMKNGEILARPNRTKAPAPESRNTYRPK